jgi:hypothetical protein
VRQLPLSGRASCVRLRGSYAPPPAARPLSTSSQLTATPPVQPHAASLLGLGALLTQLAAAGGSAGSSPEKGRPAGSPAAPGAPGSPALEEVLGALQALLATPGFLKKHLGAKSALVRRSAYVLVAGVCKRAPQLLDDCLEAATQAALGAFQVRGGGCGATACASSCLTCAEATHSASVMVVPRVCSHAVCDCP